MGRPISLPTRVFDPIFLYPLLGGMHGVNKVATVPQGESGLVESYYIIYCRHILWTTTQGNTVFVVYCHLWRLLILH